MLSNCFCSIFVQNSKANENGFDWAWKRICADSMVCLSLYISRIKDSIYKYICNERSSNQVLIYDLQTLIVVQRTTQLKLLQIDVFSFLTLSMDGKRIFGVTIFRNCVIPGS